MCPWAAPADMRGGCLSHGRPPSAGMMSTRSNGLRRCVRSEQASDSTACRPSKCRISSHGWGTACASQIFERRWRLQVVTCDASGCQVSGAFTDAPSKRGRVRSAQHWKKSRRRSVIGCSPRQEYRLRRKSAWRNACDRRQLSDLLDQIRTPLSAHPHFIEDILVSRIVYHR